MSDMPDRIGARMTHLGPFIIEPRLNGDYSNTITDYIRAYADEIERLREALRQMDSYPMAYAARQILYTALAEQEKK